jgi:hypothetical protein
MEEQPQSASFYDFKQAFFRELGDRLRDLWDFTRTDWNDLETGSAIVDAP